MNMVISMSYGPNSGITCGVVLTWSDEQTAFTSEELKRVLRNGGTISTSADPVHSVSTTATASGDKAYMGETSRC